MAQNITVRLSPEQVEAIDQTAAALGMTRSELLRAALRPLLLALQPNLFKEKHEVTEAAYHIQDPTGGQGLG